MALDINALRSAFQKKTQGSENSGFWDKFYPFYKMNIGETAVVRFLPDANEENPLGFLVVNQYHELLINGKKKKVACLKMYGEDCPACAKSKGYYDAGDETMGKTFWRKLDYVAQVIVMHSPFDQSVKPEDNPVRLISLGPKIYKKIEAAIVSGDMDAMPFDLTEGYDFRINKTQQGQWADYSTSDFARKQSPAPAESLSHPAFELYDLSKYRFAKVERDQMEMMIAAFETGRSYEDSSSSEGTPANGPAVDTVKQTAPAEQVVQAAQAAQPTAAPADGVKKLSPQEILAKLKNRGTPA